MSVPISAADLLTILTPQIIGQNLYPRSDAETAAFVSPTNYAYPCGNVLRYGAIADSTQTIDGTDCTQAFQSACAQCVENAAGAAAVFVPQAPEGFGYLLETPVFPPSGVTIEGTGFQSRLFTSLANPVNIFRTGNALGIGTGVSDIRLRKLHFDGRRKSSAIIIPGSRSRLNALVFMGTDPTAVGADWSTNIQVDDCDFTEAIHNHLSFETVDGVRVVNIRVAGNGLDGNGTNYIGNCDGVHFNNCRNFSLDVARIDSGDDMVGITTDASALGSAFRGQITDIIGSSRETNGVVVNGEGGSTTNIFDVQVARIQFTSGSGQGTAGRAKQIGTEIISQVTFNEIIGRDCGAALDFTTVSDCHADGIQGYDCRDHAIRIVTTTDCSLGKHTTYNAGSNTGNFSGLHILSNTRVKIAGPGFHQRADLWGVNFDSNLSSEIDDVVCIGCGRRTGTANRGGFRLNSNADCIVGPRLRAADDGSGFTAYGIQVISDNRSRLIAQPENFSGITLGVQNPAGLMTTPGGPIAWAYITDNGVGATLAAAKNIASITRNARGDYDLTYTGQIFRPTDGVMMLVTGSASSGNNNADMIFKPVVFNLGSCRVKVTNGAGALAAITDLYVQIFGTYFTR